MTNITQTICTGDLDWHLNTVMLNQRLCHGKYISCNTGANAEHLDQHMVIVVHEGVENGAALDRPAAADGARAI